MKFINRKFLPIFTPNQTHPKNNKFLIYYIKFEDKIGKLNLYSFYSIHLFYNYQTRVKTLSFIPLLNS